MTAVTGPLSLQDLKIVATVQADSAGTALPDAEILFRSDYSHLGDDLLLRMPDGRAILVEDYFALDVPGALWSPTGARLTPEMVEALASSRAPGHYAQASPGAGGAPIGTVGDLSGSAQATRADGSIAVLQQGDPVFQGDLLRTGAGSTIALTFNDGTVFSLSENGRIVLDQFIYDPGQSSGNAMGVSLIQGAFAFVTGQVAPTGGVEIKTPVGNIGIRGSDAVGSFDAGTETFFFIYGSGNIVFDGHIFSQPGETLRKTGVLGGQALSTSTPEEVEASFEDVIDSAKKAGASFSPTLRGGDGTEDPTEEQSGEADQEGDADPIETAAGPDGSNGGQAPGSGSNIYDNTPDDSTVESPATDFNAGVGSGSGPPSSGATNQAPPGTEDDAEDGVDLAGDSRNDDVIVPPFDPIVAPSDPMEDGGPGLTGTGGNDVLIGSPGADQISGGGGDDQITGRGGDDVIDGGSGNDSILYSVGDGNDTIDGGTGLDILAALGDSGGNSFSISASAGDSSLAFGADGASLLVSGVEILGVVGGGGGDTLLVSGDLNAAGVLRDTIVFDGGPGDDLADASGLVSIQRLVAAGNAGSDTLIGGNADDVLEGGSGNDTLIGNGGNDLLSGGAGGEDVAVFSGNREDYTVTANGTETVVTDNLGGDGSDTLTGVEILRFADQSIGIPGAGTTDDVIVSPDRTIVGDTAAGNLTVAGGSVFETAELIVGNTVTGIGTTLAVNPGSSIQIGDRTVVGSAGFGIVAVNSGAQFVNASDSITVVGLEATGNGLIFAEGRGTPGTLFDAGSLLVVGAGFDFVNNEVLPLVGGVGQVVVTDGATLRAGAAQQDDIDDIFIGGSGTLFMGPGGRVEGDVIAVRGTILVGGDSSTASVQLTGDLTAQDATLFWEIQGSGPGEADRLDVSGTADFSGGTVFFDFDGFSPALNDSFLVLSAAGGIVDDDNTAVALLNVDQALEADVELDATSTNATLVILSGHGGGDSTVFLGGDGDSVFDTQSASADRLDGGMGADRLTSGGGADVFVLRDGDGGATVNLADVFTDFEDRVDRIFLDDGLAFQNLIIANDVDGNATIQVNGSFEYLAVLAGIDSGQIDQSDFV